MAEAAAYRVSGTCHLRLRAAQEILACCRRFTPLLIAFVMVLVADLDSLRSGANPEFPRTAADKFRRNLSRRALPPC
jgi:hypothetical protein